MMKYTPASRIEGKHKVAVEKQIPVCVIYQHGKNNKRETDFNNTKYIANIKNFRCTTIELPSEKQ